MLIYSLTLKSDLHLQSCMHPAKQSIEDPSYLFDIISILLRTNVWQYNLINWSAQPCSFSYSGGIDTRVTIAAGLTETWPKPNDFYLRCLAIFSCLCMVVSPVSLAWKCRGQREVSRELVCVSHGTNFKPHVVINAAQAWLVIVVKRSWISHLYVCMYNTCSWWQTC